jgi:glycerol-3-phosphate dehydrogenase
VGYRLGQGEPLDTIIKTLGSVAEGVTTAKGLKKLIDELGVDAPIATGVSVSYILRVSLLIVSDLRGSIRR